MFDKIYDAAYHIGRHDERHSLAIEGWFVLNPNKIREFKEAFQDPCKYCKIYESYDSENELKEYFISVLSNSELMWRFYS